MSKATPQKFGKYILLERLANGGMAQLFKARITGEEGFEKIVAIKKIHPHLCDEEELVMAFIDEARLAAKLHHQNILQIYDFGKAEDTYFIAMEFLAGLDLKQILLQATEAHRKLGLEHALHIISQVCSGLEYAHNLKDEEGRPLNIIHRDISPANIFITENGEVKIIDFGIAKAESHNRKTTTGLIRGKFRYISPEQAAGKKVDHRSDIYSLGVVLYEMLAGRQMFDGEFAQVLGKVLRGEFVPLEEACGDYQPEIYRIVNKAIGADPEARYQSCAEMLTDVEALLSQLSLRPNNRSLAALLQEYFAEAKAGQPAPVPEPEQETRIEMPDTADAEPVAAAKPDEATILDINETKFQPDISQKFPKKQTEKKQRSIILPVLFGLFLLLIFWFFSGKDKIYTAYNIWLNDSSHMLCINYKMGDTILPAGTRVKEYSVDKADETISFTTQDGEKIKIGFVDRWHPGKTVDDYAAMMFSPKKFSKLTRKMSRKEIKAIKKGELVEGMSREAVIVAYGYPPEHVTPTLSNRTWTYWRTRSRREKVCFDQGGELTLPCN